MENIIFFQNKSFELDQLFEKLILEPDDIVYLSGSIIESKTGKLSKGIGNPKSDIDVFILRKQEFFIKLGDFDYNEGVNKTAFYRIDGFNIDVEIYDINKVIELFTSVNNMEIDLHTRIINSFNLPNDWDYEKANYFLSRFFYGMPISNVKQFKILKDKCQFSKFQFLYKEQQINYLDNIIDDITGSLEINELDVALYSIRNAVLVFYKIILYLNNEFVDRDKWIIPKIFNLIKSDKQKYSDLALLYKMIFLENLVDNDIRKNKILNSLEFINEKLESILLGGILL